LKTGLNIIGRQVRRLRYERGMSQPQLAAKCQRLGWDIERDTIAKIEATSRWVGDRELLKLACALEVSLDALFAPVDRKALTRKQS
jgi:transcriptional regulator with XRE-family HTH domain